VLLTHTSHVVVVVVVAAATADVSFIILGPNDYTQTEALESVNRKIQEDKYHYSY
jgi:hypothetical protein